MGEGLFEIKRKKILRYYKGRFVWVLDLLIVILVRKAIFKFNCIFFGYFIDGVRLDYIVCLRLLSKVRGSVWIRS